MAKPRKRVTEGVAVHSGDHATAVARKNARWTRVPPAYQMRQGDEDSHELYDALTAQEQRDVQRYQQGDMQKCYIGTKLEEEEEREREERTLRELGLWDELNPHPDAQYH